MTNPQADERNSFDALFYFFWQLFVGEFLKSTNASSTFVRRQIEARENDALVSKIRDYLASNPHRAAGNSKALASAKIGLHAEFQSLVLKLTFLENNGHITIILTLRPDKDAARPGFSALYDQVAQEYAATPRSDGVTTADPRLPTLGDFITQNTGKFLQLDALTP